MDGDRSFIPMDDPVRLRYQVQPFPAEARSALNFAIETYGFQMDLSTWGGGLKTTHGDRLKDVGQAIVETPNFFGQLCMARTPCFERLHGSSDLYFARLLIQTCPVFPVANEAHGSQLSLNPHFSA